MLSCKYNHRFTIQSNGKMVIVDSSEITQNRWPYYLEDGSAFFPVYYIGKLKDTVFFGANPRPRHISRYDNDTQYYTNPRNLAVIDSCNMKIVVDTLYSLSYTLYYRSHPFDDERVRIDSTKSYKAFPVFVYNLSDSILFVGHFSELGHTVREAKDRQGHWKEIENLLDYGCFYAARNLLIRPREVLIAKMLRYEGNFKTLCRLKFKMRKAVVYSNTFMDYINEKQLTDSLRKSE